jgi:hypothetical protein
MSDLTERAEQVAQQLVCDWMTEVNGRLVTPETLEPTARKFVKELTTTLLTLHQAMNFRHHHCFCQTVLVQPGDGTAATGRGSLHRQCCMCQLRMLG